ncbi:cytosolic carboxypeptidase Nna1 isoform X2 [Drosophila albomicans]|uniref:Cytosolic carboxypeptidase Nna1 isoform X2 n=1 Tax=Drosophila albomicans TaxID=7291 RepID=A0A9C6SZ32_DROAB|nr:cytosolic carboxypeptidase Nna1 isoform X2 [Drosophila albomicans]
MQKCAKDNWAARAAHENIESQYQKQCDAGFLGNFLSKGLKTNQLVLNTDEKTLRPIARLKEPRDLFALPKDKDNDCSQQAPRWPIECQVIEERVVHIPYVPPQAEPLNVPTGNELKPRPVGEENGIIVFTYCPISAVNYENSNVKSKAEDKSSEDSDDSSDSRNDFTPLSRRMTMRNTKGQLNSISKILNSVDDRSTSNSQDEEDDDGDTSGEGKETRQVGEQTTLNCPSNLSESKKKCFGTNTAPQESSDIEDIWTSNSTEYKPASPYYVLSEFGKKVPKTMIIDKIIENDQPQTQHQQQQQPPPTTCNSTSSKVQNNRYAVTPFRIPKSNISRLEAAFQIPSRLTTSDKSLSNPSKKCNAAIDGEAEHNHNVLDDILMSDSECSSGRLAGGADKLPSTSSSSVSETDTLVGDETESVLPSSENKMPEATGQLAQSSSPKQTVSMAAAVAAVARGRRRGFEPVTCSSDILGLSHLSTKSINTSSTFVELSNDKSPPPSPDIDSTNETTSSFQSQPISNDIPQMQFSRSAVGGAKFVTNCHPMNAEEYDSLEFESRFESGNLAKAVQITPTYYELYLRPDLYTSRSKQWFYFRVRRTHRNMLYRFSIVNLVKSDSLYNDGMRPVMYSTLGAKEKSEGWRRCGNNISYYRNDDESNNTNEEDEDNSSYTLTFTIEFEHDDDTVYFAHSYPYTYSDLQDYLMEIQRHPVKSKFCKLRLLCRTLAGNNVYYLTVTAPSNNEDIMRRKKSIVVSARVHPSETPSSWMMKGLMDFITGDTTVAKRLRHKFIFKLVPMLNPDGVIVGNTRNSLTGKDLNRQYRTVIRETYPSIWYTKAMIRRLIEECGVAMYCDMHAHSRKHNIFIYGCENKRNPEKRLTEQVFPLMLHKNSADRFSFESCKFKIQRSKEGTGRIVVWMLGITNSYTIEASFGGSSLGSRKGTHFNTQDYEHMGRAFCETLLDYCDENPNKVKRHAKLFKQIKKIRKREKREQKALKLQKMADQILNLLKQQERLRSKIIERLMREGSSADEPLNIPLSDYSSDEGNCSSSSDNEGKHSIAASDLEGPCCAPIRAPPSSPEVMNEIRKFRVRRMHKVMHVLDQIYFSPVLQRKFKALARLKRRRHKLGCKTAISNKRMTGGEVALSSLNENVGTSNTHVQITTIKSTRPSNTELLDSSESNVSQSSSDIATDVNSDSKQTSKQQSSRKKIKKKKFMPIEKGKSKTINRKTRIDRNLRLWLANRRIFIFRRKNKNRRQRVRSKPLKKRGEVARTALDLPTTDPGSDLHFSTDDEELSPTGKEGFGAVAPLRHTLLQSELQRRYIEEIGDMVVKKPKAVHHHMPPELIVTTPSKITGPGGVKTLEIYKLTPRTAPEQQEGVSQVKTGHAISPAARRTYSWHNLNQESGHARPNFFAREPKPSVKIYRAPPRRNVPSNFIPLAQQRNGGNADDLQLKLSLKKKIWTGAHGEPENRPLAWYKGNQCKAHPQLANVMASAAAAATAMRSGGGQAQNVFGASNKELMASAGGTATTPLPPAYVGAPRRSRKVDQVDLFNACSQKLLMWQQEHKKLQPMHARLMGGTSTSVKLDDSHVQMRTSKPKKGTKTASDSEVVASTGKGKRKSSIIKIAETTQLVTRFSRTRNNTGCSGGNNNAAQKQQMTQMQRLIFKGTEQMNNASAVGLQQQSAGGRTASKFKTGGIVVTAVQQSIVSNTVAGSAGGVSRRMRHAGLVHLKSGPTTVVDDDNAVQYRRNSSSVQINKPTTAGGISLDTVSLVRKVKTKLKKRKSRTLAKAASAAVK